MKKIIIVLSLCIFGAAGFNSSVSAKSMHDKSYKKSYGKSYKKHYRKRHAHKLDRQLRKIIQSNSLTGNPLSNRIVPDISSPQAQLGMDLFFSKSLGGEYDSACVTCHHPALGGGDNLSLPIGVEADIPDLLGPGRTNNNAPHNPENGGPAVPRNAPTTFNVVAWDKFQFHDGRLESLDKIQGANGAGEKGIRTPDWPLGIADPLAGNNLVQAQARFPVTSNEEMKGFKHETYSAQAIREYLAARLGDYGTEESGLIAPNHWLEKFQFALSSPDGSAEELITEQNISMLLAEYERSQAFVDTPWKRYIEGNRKAISKKAKKGAILFYTSSSEGGANCSSCHTGDFFTDESFHNLAMPQIGPGKGDGKYGSKDYGRARETDNPADMFAFRTPSLLNVEVTGPWSHAGAYTTLKAVIKHHLNAKKAIRNYDEFQLSQPDIRNLDQMFEHTKEAMDSSNFALKETIRLSNRQINSLVAFLKTLTDPCTQDRKCLGQWIPDAEKRIDPNGDQLNAIDQYGNLL